MASARQSSRRRPRTHPLHFERLETRNLLTGGLDDPDLVVTPAAIPLQPVGVPFVDTTFGTTLRRVSNTSDQGGFETQIYSQLQAFSSDNAYLLLTGSNGYVVRRVSDLTLVAGLNTDEWNVPRWHPTQPHVLVHFDTNADTDVTVQFTNVDTGITTNVFTLPPQYHYIRGNQSFDELSDDGRWLAGMVTRSDGESVLVSVDIQNRSLGAVLALSDIYTTHAQPDPIWGEVEPDWVGVSPLGGYMVVGWQRDGTQGACGVETFNIQTGAFVGRVNDGHQHGDLGVLPDGVTEYYMTFEVYGTPLDNNRPAIGVRLLPGNSVVSQPSYLQSLDWGNGEHISARGPNGVALVTSGTDVSNGWTNFEGEVWLQYTDNSVLRLAHHRSTSSDYWVQPRASISRDGRYMVFASDWGRQTGGRGDPYIIDLEAGDVPDGNSPPVLGPLSQQTVNEGTLLAFTATASDPDGDALQFSLDAGAPAGAAINSNTGNFTWTPSAAQGPATYSLTVRVTDNGSPNLSDTQTITITVLDPPRLGISDVTVTEGNTGTKVALFTITLTASSSQSVSVEYATAGGTATVGSDFQNRTGTLLFNPGQTSKAVSVPVVGDQRDEPDETFFVNLANAANATIADGQGQGTIVDNDPPPALTINRITVTEGDAGTLFATLTVRLSAPSGKQVSVNYSTAPGSATAGSDYVSTSGVLTFQPGETSKTISVGLMGDLLDEPNETISVNLANAANATLPTSQGRITIADNDPPPALSIDSVTIQEGKSGKKDLVFTVSLSEFSGKPVTVAYATSNGTASSGSDYLAASGTLTFAPGETTKTIRITIFGDAIFELQETFFVDLSNPQSATLAASRGTGSILNAR